MSDQKRNLSVLLKVPKGGLFGLFSGPYIAVDESSRVFIGQPGKMKEDKPQAVLRSLGNVDSPESFRVRFENGDHVDVEWRGCNSVTAKFNDAVIHILDATDEELVASLKIANLTARSKSSSIGLW